MDIVPTWMSTRPWSPKWSTEPRPLRPSTPEAWASSTNTAAPTSSAASTMPGSGAMSPSIEKTPSVTTRIRRYGPEPSGRPFSAASRRISRSAATSRVREDLARRLREAHAVDDRGVVERVGDDQVLLAGDRRDDAGVRGEAGLERQDRLDALELGELGLERLVLGHRAGDRPDRAGADAELADGRERRVAQARVVGQPEVVVRGQRDHLAAVDDGDRALGRAHHPQRPVEVLRLEVVDLGRDEGERIRRGRGRHRTASP